MAPIVRFAPSPNGFLHLGHAYSALLNWRMAQENGGRFLLRIEDIDTSRCRPEFEATIYEDLTWLGLSWEQPVLRQRDRFSAYRRLLERLIAMDLVYAAGESRADLARRVAAWEAAEGEGTWPRDPDGAPLYPGPLPAVRQPAEAFRAGDRQHVLRLDMAKAAARAGEMVWEETGVGGGGEAGCQRAAPLIWGDVILARRDVPTSYHLSVVADDAHQGITHVVRGQDLFAATSVHRLLQTLLNLPAPVYHHHPLIRDADGRKLGKSTAATGLRELRAQGLRPADIRDRIGFN